jgi:rod shape-determining protein MreC
MRSITTRSILLISLALVFLLSLSVYSSQKLQGMAAALAKPLWTMFHASRGNEADEKIAELKLENLLLKDRLFQYKELIGNDPDSDTTPLLARVVYRCPISWNSSLWINVGEKDNEESEKKLIAKNSPVVLGTSLIGVVETVQTGRSQVRLITDPDLTPSVRALRSDESGNPLYLAKGELHGSAKIFWRSRGSTLIGEGFNYDYDDNYGPAKDLRSNPAILKVGDLLVTTGMDGIFPAGLHVARVTKIQSLREGDYYYEIEAIPTAESIEELSLVHVLPPL